jgi:hypothetical protein
MSRLSTTYILRKDQSLRCDERALTVHVVAGRVWLTLSGDTEDHFLSAGESRAVPARARALLSAEGGPAQLRIEPQAARLKLARNTPAATNRLPKVRFSALS